MAWTTDHLYSDRLVLRPFVDDDKPRIIELMTSGRVQRYLGGPLPADEALLIREATVGERWGSFCAADRSTNRMLGTVTFDREHGELEVSYQLLPGSWGRGIALEMVDAALRWAVDETDDTEVIAVTQTANGPSVALLERLGFAREKSFEEFGAEQTQFRRLLARS